MILLFYKPEITSKIQSSCIGMRFARSFNRRCVARVHVVEHGLKDKVQVHLFSYYRLDPGSEQPLDRSPYGEPFFEPFH
jgi:hypothetical protein